MAQKISLVIQNNLNKSKKSFFIYYILKSLFDNKYLSILIK